MASATTTPEASAAIQAFVRLVRASVAVTGKLSTQLSADHGLTLNAYEALLWLARAPDRRMRRVDLADSLLLTASGVTRLLDGLERDGLVGRDVCATDRRVTYAVLTDAGRAKLREADRTHTRQIRELMGAGGPGGGGARPPRGQGGAGGAGRGQGARGGPNAEKVTALRKETTEKIVAVLNDDQKKSWKELTGEPFELPAARPAPKKDD